MIEIVGPLYFELGTELLEALWHSMCNWPEPKPGVYLDLPVVGNVINYVIAESEEKALVSDDDFIDLGTSSIVHYKDISIVEFLGIDIIRKVLF